MRRGLGYGSLAGIGSISLERGGLAMADEQADGGAAEGAEAIAAPKGKLKLIIAAVGVLAILGGGTATWFLLFKSGPGGEA